MPRFPYPRRYKKKHQVIADRIEQLLKVLDLTEEEQFDFVVRQPLGIISGFMAFDWHEPENRKSLLADLAFRLRDETPNFGVGCDQVWRWLREKYSKDGKNREVVLGTNIYFYYYAQPIHWIIAALIAKELSK
jgi:hypothetical protein